MKKCKLKFRHQGKLLVANGVLLVILLFVLRVEFETEFTKFVVVVLRKLLHNVVLFLLQNII